MLMTISSQPDQATRPRLIVNPIIWVNGRKWWLPLEDLELFDRWLAGRGFRRAHVRPVYRGRGRVSRTYSDAAGDVVTVSPGGLIGATGAGRSLLESLADENRQMGVSVHSINAARRAAVAGEKRIE
jgi:hypothetical protein